MFGVNYTQLPQTIKVVFVLDWTKQLRQIAIAECGWMFNFKMRHPRRVCNMKWVG
jgi:hypothetical protein